MQTRIELFEDGDDVRLQAATAVEVKAALFNLIFRGTIRAGLVGVTMNTAVVEGDVEEIEQALEADGYTVV